MSESQQHGKDYIPMGKGTRQQRYTKVHEELIGRLNWESHPLSNTSNLIAILKQEFNWWWIGYYWVARRGKTDYLALGQFQGPPACTDLQKGKGVCGTAWQTKSSIVLQDVDKFQGHIACSSASKSQIVIPIMLGDEVVGVLDIDAANYGEFSLEDEKWLKILLDEIAQLKQFEWFKKNM